VSDPNQAINRIVWADIPVADLDRAAAFYAAVLAIQVPKETFGAESFCVLEHQDGSGGCLVINPAEVSATGMLVYFNVQGRIQAAAAEVEARGGRILIPIHPIGPHGFRTVILDSEGNRLALHSMVDA
jgi:predicted enzyme related to lactoylglutathione lyase